LGEEPAIIGADFPDSVVSMFLDHNFNIVFAVFKNGTVAEILQDGSISPITSSITDNIVLAKGSLLSDKKILESTQKKVRLFVGSAEGTNDRWDSGEIETAKQEMLYGGGNNLMHGEAYWLSVSIMNNFGEWSEPTSIRFVVPMM